MGLIKGALKSLGGAAKIVTSPLTTGLKMAGTSLKTGGKVLGELAEGDLGGALNAATTGAKEQVGNVTGHFTGNLDNLKQIGSGHREFLFHDFFSVMCTVTVRAVPLSQRPAIGT